MGLFSQRQGIQPLVKTLQLESMDADLRTFLWNALDIHIWRANERLTQYILTQLWLYHFKQPYDQMPTCDHKHQRSAYQYIRERYYTGVWHEVYDILQFIIDRVLQKFPDSDLVSYINTALEEENSAYRVIDGIFVPITDDHEISTIESALGSGTDASKEHLSCALNMLSDRTNPDFRNSIKESISAVEAICQWMTDSPKATLGECLQIIRKREYVHPALEGAFSKLYGFTSDAGGIRHALTDEGYTPSISDAKFMLVASAGFVNLILAKTAELGIK